MNLPTRNTRKLYMAIASKGKYQYECECANYDDWNQGIAHNPREVRYSLIKDDLEIEESDLGSRVVQSLVNIEDDSFFNKIYFSYDNQTDEKKSFYIKYVCIEGYDDRCLPVDVRNASAVLYSDSKREEYTELNLTKEDVGEMFKTGESKFGFEGIFNHGTHYEITFNNKVRYRDVKRIIWNYYTDDPTGVKELSVGSNLNLYRDGDVVVHNGNLWAAYGDINDMDDEPSKSIHWEFLCSCDRDKFRIETPTPTPTPTLTPTATNTPTPTPTYEDVVCWCDEYAPWHARNYEWKSIVSHDGFLYQAHDYQGTEAMDVPGESHHWFQLCKCIELCYPPRICVRVEESLGWNIEMEHSGGECLGTSAQVTFNVNNGIPKFDDENRFINAIRFSYEGTTEDYVHFNTSYFALYHNETVIELEDYTLVDPFGNELQHAYCAGESNKISDHGLAGSVDHIFEQGRHADHWGIPITKCGGYFTLFLRKSMDISSINRIVWHYGCGDACGKRKISFRNVLIDDEINGTYQLSDPESEWTPLETIKDATNHRKAGYKHITSNRKLCQNKPKLGKRAPVVEKMPLSTYELDNFNNLSRRIILATEVSSSKYSCCNEYDNTIPTYGDNVTRKSLNGLGVKFFELGGMFCFNNLKLDSASAGQGLQYGIKIEIGDDQIYGMIYTIAPLDDTNMVYVSPDGKYYSGSVESTNGFDNLFEFTGICEELAPTPTPTTTPTPTITTLDVEPIIDLSQVGLNLEQRIWTNTKNIETSASILGDVSINNKDCELGINMAASGGHLVFPTLKIQEQSLTFGVVFEIKGNGETTGNVNPNIQYIVFQQNVRTEENEGFYLSYEKTGDTTGKLSAGMRLANGNLISIDSEDGIIERNIRYHAFVVISDDKVNFYLNGKLVGTSEKPMGINYHPSHKLCLGRKKAVGSFNDTYMNGVIYGFELYDKVLNEAQVVSKYEDGTCPPTPTPTPTATQSNTQTTTPTPEFSCLDYKDDRTWTLLDTSFQAFGSSCISDSIWENNESDAWQVVVEPTECPELECCRNWLTKYEVGPETDTIVDGESQITIGKQLYGGTMCVDKGKGDVGNILINEVTLYIESNKPVGTIIFMGNVNEYKTVYLSVTGSSNAEKFGYPYLNGKCLKGEIVDEKCILEEIG